MLSNKSNSVFLFGFVLMSHSVFASESEHLNEVPIGAERIIGGDILTGPRLNTRGVAHRGGSHLWEDGIVPYLIDPELNPISVDYIEEAIETWNSVAGISLVPLLYSDVSEEDDYIHFQHGEGCASWVGRQGGPQAIWVAPSCSAGSMMHEIGHALGLQHEHTRSDRDQYIKVNWHNIRSNRVNNFEIVSRDNTNFGEYDYDSIMHYGESYFSLDGSVTIERLDGSSARIGQRTAPSAGDLAAVAKLYASDLSLSVNLNDEAGKSELTVHVSNNYRQGAHQIVLALHKGEAQLEDNYSPDWECKEGSDTAELLCSIDRLPGTADSQLFLVFDRPIDHDALDAKVSSKTPDSDMSNNSNGGGSTPVQARAVSLLSNDSHVASDDETGGSAGSIGYALFSLLMLMLISRQASLVSKCKPQA